MQDSVKSAARIVCLIALVLYLAQTAMAKPGRDFAGTYQITNVSESGDTVHLTIALTLRNNSGGDISDGGVVLFDSEANPSVIGTFRGIKVFHSYERVTMIQNFTVSEEEYQRWQEGRNPSLRFLVEDPNGALRTVSIDLQREMPKLEPAQ